MSDDLIVKEELDDSQEEIKEPDNEEPEKTGESDKPKTRYDAWDRDTAIKNYQELEKLNSRQAQELGMTRKEVSELRDVVDKHLQQPSEENVDLDTFLENPNDAVSKSVESNPTVRKIQDKLTQIEQQSALQEITAKHPDWQDVVASPAFQNWVQEDSIRQDIYGRANNYDAAAANYLLSDFKKQESVVEKQVVEEARESKAKEDMQKAASEGAGGTVSEKIFRRGDLIRLRMTDPEKYDEMQGEILKAYQEGRVR